MYEIPQRNLSDSGYEKALELSPISKSSSSQEQLSSSCNTGTNVLSYCNNLTALFADSKTVL